MAMTSPGNSISSRYWASITLVLLFGLFLLTGCVQQRAELSEGIGLSSTPTLDERATVLDFSYPSRPPSLATGKEIFTRNCLQCHASGFQGAKSQQNFLYSTPIDMYVMLTTGKPPVLKKESDVRRQIRFSEPHPSFRESLTRDERWAAIFYARHLAGGSDIAHRAVGNEPDIKAVFGGNCAVCHGNEGNADGPLHLSHGGHDGLEGTKVHGGIFQPAPARFTQFSRMFNRTDAQIFKYIAEGIYPSGMPAWYDNRDVGSGYTFDDELIWMLVKQIRAFTFTADLPEDAPKPAGLTAVEFVPELSLDIPPVRPLRPNAYTGADTRKDAYQRALVPRMGVVKKMNGEDAGSPSARPPARTQPGTSSPEGETQE